MAIKNKNMLVAIGVILLVIFVMQPREKKEAGASFQAGYTGDTTGGLLIYADSMDAQTFRTTNSFELSSFKIKVNRNGNPGIISVSLRLASKDMPLGEDLVFSAFDGNTIPELAGIIDIPMPSYTIQKDTDYSLVIKAMNGNLSNRITLFYASGGNPYSNGNQVSFTNAAGRWVPNLMDDTYFEIWGQPVISTAYQSFLAAKNNYLNGGGFIELITNANSWILS